MKTLNATIMTKGHYFGWVAAYEGNLHGIIIGHTRDTAVRHCERWAAHLGCQVEVQGEIKHTDLPAIKWLFGISKESKNEQGGQNER